MLASSLGFVVGPTLISLFTARCGMEKLYLIVIPGAIVTAALLKFFSRETGEGPRQNAKRRMNPFRAVLSPIFPLFLSALAISITAMNLYSLVPILFRQRGVSIETVGFFLSLFALGCAVGPLLGSVLARRCGKSVMMVIASACSIAFLPLFVLTQGPFVLNISLFLFLGTA